MSEHARPRLFLVPQWAPAEWTIQPGLSEWADVASYDYAAAIEKEAVTRDLFVDTGLAQLDELGWERFYVVGDTFGTATAARIALERRERVEGVALGHASLSYGMDGERPAINRELWAAMSQLISQDAGSFIRYGITQLTQGGYDEDVAQQMVDRVPAGQMQAAWNLIRDEHEPIGEMLREIDRPLLLAKHDGCLMFTDTGFEDATAAFPSARTVSVSRPPSADEEFTHALREFCLG
jgi:pimeloyl-ACP methyl ester carboxylesterase